MARIELPLAAIADAGPIIHLDQLGVLEILAGFSEVLVPTVVAAEADRHRPDWKQRAPRCIRVRDPDPGRLRSLSEEPLVAQLDPGEIAALALWDEYRAAVLLCDDLAARRQARKLGCDVTGTLGLLLWSARIRRLSVDIVRQLVADLPKRSTLHIRSELIAEAIQSLDDLDG